MNALRALKTRHVVIGSLKRLFISDYKFLRQAGLTKRQAFKLCKVRYSERSR